MSTVWLTLVDELVETLTYLPRRRVRAVLWGLTLAGGAAGMLL